MNLQQLLADALDYLRGMWRFRWWALGVSWCVMIGGALFVYSMPDVYRASTRVYVDTESLLRPLMQGLTATQNSLSELQILSRLVLTRPNMETVAQNTDLHLRARTPEALEELITDLQKGITVSGGRDNIFAIEYEDPDRKKAEDVVGAVRDIFVEGPLGDQGNETAIAERTLAEELAISANRLRDKEQEIARFKQENLGYLPDQIGDYYDRVQSARGRHAQTERALELAIASRDALRRQVAGEDPVIGIMPGTSYGGCSHGAQIADLEAQRSNFLVRFTESHPTYVSLGETLEQLKAKCEEESAVSGVSLAASAGSVDANPVFQNMRMQLSDHEVAVERLRAQQALELQEIEQLQQDYDKSLRVEADYKELTRGLESMRARNQELLKRSEDLQTQIRINPVAAGVRFDTIDPPFAEKEPTGPNRPLLLSGVLAAALGAGAVLAFLLNQMSPVYFTRHSLKRVVEYPVIGSVSMLLPPDVVGRRRMEAVTWGISALMIVVFAGVTMLAAPQAGPLLRNIIEGVGT